MTVRMLVGDCMQRVRELPDDSVNSVVTSPPYFGLRSYLPDGHPDKHLELGLEPTPEEFVTALVELFREVRRVLRYDGTVWLNLGDSYAGSGRGGNVSDTSGLEGGLDGQEQCRAARKAVSAKSTLRGNGHFGGGPKIRGSTLPAGFHERPRKGGAIGRAWVPPPDGLKQKDLIGIPWMVAFALRADGWFLRSAIIWAKPNGMPGSQDDRPTSSYEFIFLLSKSARYWSDFDAIKTPPRESTSMRLAQDVQAQAGSHRANGGGKTNGPMRAVSAGGGGQAENGQATRPLPAARRIQRPVGRDEPRRTAADTGHDPRCVVRVAGRFRRCALCGDASRDRAALHPGWLSRRWRRA